MRLDRFLANNTNYSRSEITRLIKQKRVTLNQLPVSSGALPVSKAGMDNAAIDGQVVTLKKDTYLMLYKPAGYVCATRDGEHPTVIDLLAACDDFSADKIQVAGRLDIDTTGLVLLTSDGDWNHRITSPSKACGKTYRVETADPIDENTLTAIRRGIQLRGEPKSTLPALVEQQSSHSVLLTLNEGKYHQVKRMFGACGNRVTQLHRISIGNIQLDPTLKPGEYRHLTAQEYAL